MSYKLFFEKKALKEFNKLNSTIKNQFKKKLAERLENPRVKADKLTGVGFSDCYKIKLRKSGFRLIYYVEDKTISILVIGVGKRNKNLVYDKAKKK